MFTFVQYRREYETTLARLEAEYQRLTLQEKSQRVLGRDNPLLYSSRVVAAKMGGRGLSDRTVERQLDRQAPQFEGIAHHTLVCVPFRPSRSRRPAGSFSTLPVRPEDGAIDGPKP